MVEFFERSLRQAVSSGHCGVRVADEMTWALSVGCGPTHPFEALLNDSLSR